MFSLEDHQTFKLYVLSTLFTPKIGPRIIKTLFIRARSYDEAIGCATLHCIDNKGIFDGWCCHKLDVAFVREMMLTDVKEPCVVSGGFDEEKGNDDGNLA